MTAKHKLWVLSELCTCGITSQPCKRHIPADETKKRNLNPRTCRGCGLVFMPTTALQRYGSEKCKKFRKRYVCRAVPGAHINHETGAIGGEV